MSNRLSFFAFVQYLNLKLNRQNVDAASLPHWQRDKDASSTLYQDYRQMIGFLVLTGMNATYCGRKADILY
jgi:hypothetical protein